MADMSLMIVWPTSLFLETTPSLNSRLAVAVVVFLLYKAVAFLLSSRSFAQFARSKGCAAVRVAPNPFPWGLRRKYEVVKLDGDLLDDYTYRKYSENGLTHIQNAPITGTQCGVCTVEPENYKSILATNFNDWERPVFRAGAARPFLGPGIFTSDGHEWARSRKNIKPHFSRANITANIAKSEKHMKLLFQAIGATDGSGFTQTVDLMDYFYRFAMDSATEFLFGTSAFTQLYGMERVVEIPREANERFMDGFELAFKEVAGYVGIRLRLGKSYWMCDSVNYRLAVRRLYSMARPYIANARSRQRVHDDQEGRPSTMMEDMAAAGAGDEEILNQCMHLLIAGMDTTSAALGYAFALLELNPRVVEKLREAVRQSFGTESEPTSTFTFESLKDCTYLQWVISETLRLYPAGPVNARIAVRDTVLPVGGGPDGKGPVAVKKDIWGEDANEFRPERWEGRRKGYDYIPFSAGPQLCIGQQYSMTQAAFVIARFMMRYDGMEKPLGANNLKKGWKTVLTPGDGVKVRLHGASE